MGVTGIPYEAIAGYWKDKGTESDLLEYKIAIIETIDTHFVSYKSKKSKNQSQVKSKEVKKPYVGGIQG